MMEYARRVEITKREILANSAFSEADRDMFSKFFDHLDGLVSNGKAAEAIDILESLMRDVRKHVAERN